MLRLKPGDKVLDIGGWAHPFNRANLVMDIEPYQTRGLYNRTFARNNPIPSIGGDVEYFSEASWIQRDLCDKEPFPFEAKEIDYVICSHTLEDIRDPIWVCKEMVRIAKAGYIEVPSRLKESCRGHEPGIAGLSHHRWLIDIDSEGRSIRFLPKFHRIHNRRYSLPKRVNDRLTESERVQWLFWEDNFSCSEIVLHGEAQLQELTRFVDSVSPYPIALARSEDVIQKMLDRFGRALRRVYP